MTGAGDPMVTAVEALLFLSPDPVSAGELAAAIEADEEAIAEAVDALGAELEGSRRGVRLKKVEGGTRSSRRRRPRTRRAGCSRSRGPRR